MSELDDLEAKVALMRRLGVQEADGIRLGERPAPPPREETKDEWEARQVAIAERHHAIMFAASGTKPILRLAKVLKKP